VRRVANRDYRYLRGARVGIVCHEGTYRFWEMERGESLPYAVYAVESQVRTRPGGVPNKEKSPSAELGLKSKQRRKLSKTKLGRRSLSQKRAPPTVRNYHLEKQLGRVGSS
jgi:hypothetical protein